MKHISSFRNNSRLNNLNGISKPDFDFVLLNYRHLKNIKIQPGHLNPEVLEWFISQAKEALPSLQKNDKKEKTIVLKLCWVGFGPVEEDSDYYPTLATGIFLQASPNISPSPMGWLIENHCWP